MNKRNIFIYIISLLFSIMIVLTMYIGRISSFNGTFITSFHFNYLFFLPVIIISILTFIILKVILTIFSKIKLKKSKKLWNKKIVFIVSLVTIFISGLLFLLTYYPGTGMIDTVQIITAPIDFSSHYPLIYSLLFSSIFNYFFKITNSMNMSFFLMELCQLIFMSVVISYIIYWFHKTFKSNIFTFISILYFNIFTIFSNLNSAHLRDTLFSAFILLLITLLYEIIISNGKCISDDKFRFRFILVMGCITLTRNNAIFTSLILLIVLFIKYKSYYKSLIVITLSTLFLSNIVIFLPSKYHTESLFQESVAVPIQQLAYIIKYEDISNEDREYLDNLLFTEVVEEIYNPFMVDDIKWSELFDNYYINKTKNKFMNIWFKNMRTHFEGYTKAYILNTYSLWSINEFVEWESSFLSINSNYRNLHNEKIFPEKIQNNMEKFYTKTVRYVNNGTIFWIYVFLFLLLIYKNKKKFSIILLPFFCIWINFMIASPLASAFRYMCVFGYALPFIITLTFSNINERTLD